MTFGLKSMLLVLMGLCWLQMICTQDVMRQSPQLLSLINDWFYGFMKFKIAIFPLKMICCLI